FLVLTPSPLRSPLFPYTTLFRSKTFEARAGDVDPLGDRVAAVNFDRDQHRRREDERLRLRQRVPGKGVVVDSREIDAEEVFDGRSEEHTSELQSLAYLVCRLLLE